MSAFLTMVFVNAFKPLVVGALFAIAIVGRILVQKFLPEGRLKKRLLTRIEE
jgi:hypothetical protein